MMQEQEKELKVRMEKTGEGIAMLALHETEISIANGSKTVVNVAIGDAIGLVRKEQ